VLLHGWGLTPVVWAPLQDALARPCLTPELEARAGSLDQWAASMLDEIPAGASLVGWSLGAMLALAMAARAPERIDRLVLIAATPSFVQRPGWDCALDAATLAAFRANFLSAPTRTLDRFASLQALGDARRQDVVCGLRAAAVDPSRKSASLAHGLRLLEESDLRTSLPPSALRCLFIHGAQDALMPVAAMQWLAQRWSASEHLVMPDVGHAPMLSKTDEVAARMRHFLDAR
jgi:pimeloyl-[acyl-carrier protein] methyl ester esterase